MGGEAGADLGGGGAGCCLSGGGDPPPPPRCRNAAYPQGTAKCATLTHSAYTFFIMSEDRQCNSSFWVQSEGEGGRGGGRGSHPPLPKLRASHALVQATVGVGTVIIVQPERGCFPFSPAPPRTDWPPIGVVLEKGGGGGHGRRVPCARAGAGRAGGGLPSVSSPVAGQLFQATNGCAGRSRGMNPGVPTTPTPPRPTPGRCCT